MTDYITITDAQVDPEAPITSELMSALRDNPIAIIEGDVSAPKISVSAFASDYYTAGGIGSYAFARRNVSGDIAFGSTVAGSSLLTGSALMSATNVAALNMSATTQSGTWRAMGTYDHTSSVEGGSGGGITLWLRIS